MKIYQDVYKNYLTTQIGTSKDTAMTLNLDEIKTIGADRLMEYSKIAYVLDRINITPCNEMYQIIAGSTLPCDEKEALQTEFAQLVNETAAELQGLWQREAKSVSWRYPQTLKAQCRVLSIKLQDGDK